MNAQDTCIHWVTTPRCTVCMGGKELRGRPQCAGCEKLRPHPQTPASGGHHRLRTRLQDRRDAQIAALRTQGMSLRQIAREMGIPRSTVNNAVQRKLHRATKQSMASDMAHPGAA